MLVKICACYVCYKLEANSSEIVNTKKNDSDCSHETSSLETKLNKLIITSLKIMFLCYFTAMILYDVSTQTQKNPI